MKVNTDAILLGAIAEPQQSKRILDIGTGTGLIAIMLAARSQQSHITAIELEPEAFKQACENVAQCPWSDRIEVIYQDMRTFTPSAPFDLIVSNPPYFEHSLASRSVQRDLARSLPDSHLAWLAQAAKWLTPTGKISFILPTAAATKLIVQSDTISLACIEKWFISPRGGQPAKRMVVTFSPYPTFCIEKNLAIYQEDNQYTAEFKTLTRQFYLNF